MSDPAGGTTTGVFCKLLLLTPPFRYKVNGERGSARSFETEDRKEDRKHLKTFLLKRGQFFETFNCYLLFNNMLRAEKEGEQMRERQAERERENT